MCPKRPKEVKLAPAVNLSNGVSHTRADVHTDVDVHSLHTVATLLYLHSCSLQRYVV